MQGTLDDAVGKDLRPGFSPTDVTPEEEAQAKVFKAQGWKTDFTMRTVSLTEFRSAQTRDGIPSIDDPVYIPQSEAGEWLQEREPVLVLEIDGDVRAYPLQILLFHEIVNDDVGDTPVAVTYCPLCNSAVVFDRRVGERLLDFGVSGNLRFSDLVMYDRQTDSWWQQLTGEALVGELAGTQLDFIPAPIVSWEEFQRAHPEGVVLSRETGFRRPYGFNPYQGYDTGRPWLAEAYRDRRLPAMERVVASARARRPWPSPSPSCSSTASPQCRWPVRTSSSSISPAPHRPWTGRTSPKGGTSAPPTSSGPSWTANASPSLRRKRGSSTRRRAAPGTCSDKRLTARWREAGWSR